MPRHPDPYPKHMTVTDEGKSLYSIWLRIRKNTDKYCLFTEYPKFFGWAMDHYYVQGARLRRFDDSKPYTPDNCTFAPVDPEGRSLTPELRRMANEWNRTVNMFRKRCGLKLFDVYDEEEKYA